MRKLYPVGRVSHGAWPFHAALATRVDARFAIALVSWSRPDAAARSKLLTADTIYEAQDVLRAISRRLRGVTLHGPLRGGDPTNVLTAWTCVPVPPALRGAQPFATLLSAGPLERRIAAATLLQQREGTTIRFAVEGLAQAFAIIAGVNPPQFTRGRAHRPSEQNRLGEHRP